MEMFVLLVVFVWRSLTRAIARTLDPWMPDDIASAMYEAAWAVDDYRATRTYSRAQHHQ